jgi:hypothetical protein
MKNIRNSRLKCNLLTVLWEVSQQPCGETISLGRGKIQQRKTYEIVENFECKGLHGKKRDFFLCSFAVFALSGGEFQRMEFSSCFCRFVSSFWFGFF